MSAHHATCNMRTVGMWPALSFEMSPDERGLGMIQQSWRDQVVALVSWDRNEANVIKQSCLYGGNFSQQGYTCQWIPCTLLQKIPCFKQLNLSGFFSSFPNQPKLWSLEMDKLSMPESYSPMTRAASCPICWCDSIMTSAQVMYKHPGRKNMEVEHPQRKIILTLNIGDIYDPCFDLCVPRMACCSPATATFIAIRRLTATSRTLRRVIFLGIHKKITENHHRNHMNSRDLITKKTKKTDLIQTNPTIAISISNACAQVLPASNLGSRSIFHNMPTSPSTFTRAKKNTKKQLMVPIYAHYIGII